MDLVNFLGAIIDRRVNGKIHLGQQSIRSDTCILEDLRLNDKNTKTRTTPAASPTLLTRRSSSDGYYFSYRPAIWKNWIILKRPDKVTQSYPVRQCASFLANPKKDHGKAVRWLGCYLKGIACDRKTIMKPLYPIRISRCSSLRVPAVIAGSYGCRDRPRYSTIKTGLHYQLH